MKGENMKASRELGRASDSIGDAIGAINDVYDFGTVADSRIEGDLAAIADRLHSLRETLDAIIVKVEGREG